MRNVMDNVGVLIGGRFECNETTLTDYEGFRFVAITPVDFTLYDKRLSLDLILRHVSAYDNCS